ncbi:MAG: lanthionine synthetase LanC family protein, partial [Kineosporiaceae bacterium]
VIPATTPERSLPADTDGGTGRWGEAITGLVSYLRDTMGPPDADRLWPVSCVHGAPDPGIVQLGAAGVLGPLTRYVALTGDPRARETVAAAARWLRLRSGPDVQRAPGLYFGSAGIAWALYEAGRLLDDDGLTRHALDLAATLPTDPPTPDITHGTAGIGFALLHLGRRAGRPDLIDRAGACADTLVATAPTGAARTGVPSSAAGDVANRRATDDEDVLWGTPAAFDSRLAGGRFYGFAHGTAGIGAFLLATGRPDAVHLAHRAARTLHARAVTSGGLAQWGAGPGDPPTAPYWCHGASGIGTFLTRLHRASGDGRSAELAVLAGNAVLANSSRGVLGQCHGLAGNGEFLLDLAETTDRTVYRGLAARLARVILASGARRGESLVFPDEAGGVSATWADGAAGILSFLLRLRYGGPRPWTVEQAGSELHTPGSAPVAEAGAGLAAGKPG